MAGEASISLMLFKEQDFQKLQQMTEVATACNSAGVAVPPDVLAFLEKFEDGEDGTGLISWYDYSLRILRKGVPAPTATPGSNPKCVRYSLRELLDAGFDSIEFRAGGDY